MATLVSTTHSHSTLSDWPAGTQAGDLAVLVVLSEGRQVGDRLPRGWSKQGQVHEQQPRVVGGGSRSAYLEVFTYTVRQSSGHRRPPPGEDFPPAGLHPWWLFIVRDTLGAGSVRVGTGQVTAKPGGGALVAVMPPNASATLPSGVDWEPVAERQGRYGVAGFTADSGLVGAVTDWPALAMEILPPAGPAQPAWLSPEAGERSSGDPVPYEWQHRAAISGGYQDAYRLRIYTASGEWYWSQATGTLTQEVVTNESSASSVTVPAGVLTGEVAAEVQTREGLDGKWSPWSEAVVNDLVTPPSVTVGEIDAVEDVTPVVSWSSTTPRGVQTAWQLQVARLGGLIYDTGVRSGSAGEFELPVLDWVNDGVYQARLRVQQTGGSWSSWATRDFVVSWTPPAVPSVEAWAGANGVEVAVADAAVADARAALEAVLGEVPVYGPDAPADTSRAWYNAGEVRRWVDTYGPGPVTNLVTNPRGRDTNGTVTVRENYAQSGWGVGGGWANNLASSVDINKGVPVTDHPMGITTAAEFAPQAGFTGSLIANSYNVGGSGVISDTVYCGMWVKVNLAGYEARLGASDPYEMLPVNEWVFLVSDAPQGSYARFMARKAEGEASEDVRVLVTGVVTQDGVPVTSYFDGDTSPDPDLTPEWTGTPGESTSRLVAPSPVGWTPMPGAQVYYSESRDAVAIRATGAASHASVLVGSVGSHSQATALTELVDASTSEPRDMRARWDYTQTNWTRDVTAPATLRATETGVSGSLYALQANAPEPGETFYVRSAAVPGEYVGPYFDGHTFGVYWDGDPDDSTSTYPGPHWALVEDADVVDAAQALHAVENNWAGISIDLERINEQGLWDRVTSFTMPGPATTITDVLAPFGQSTAYRARAVNELDGQRFVSEWGVSGPVASTDRAAYVAAANDPVTTWLPAAINQDDAHGHNRPVAVAYGLGDTRPHTSYAPHRGRASTLTVYAEDHAERAALLGLLHAGESLVVRWPAEYAADARGFVDAGTITVDVAGEVTEERWTQPAPYQRRVLKVPWVEQHPVIPAEGASSAPVSHPIEES